MSKNLKEAFEEVRADEELKSRTKEFLYQKTKGYTHAKSVNYRHMVSAFACLAVMLLGGYWLYFIPTVEISIDINPSIELGVNRFNRIVSMASYNQDGEDLLNSQDIKFMNYSEAINQIKESEEIQSLLSDDGILTITVVDGDNTQSEEVYSEIQADAEKNNNTHCYYAQKEDLKEAHDAGLSYGKYRAFLEVQELDPDMTTHEIQHMTMHEIRDLLEDLSAEEGGKKETDCQENEKTHGKKEKQKGNGHQKGHRNQ